MTEEGKELQWKNIRKHYNDLKEEKVVTSKDVALAWIEKIGIEYDGKDGIGELRDLIDELVAYAILGYECCE